MQRRTIPITTARNKDHVQLNTILVPCDFSASSAYAFCWAVELAAITLGSVAERVVRHAACPVLVVRLPDQTVRGKGADVVP